MARLLGTLRGSQPVARFQRCCGLFPAGEEGGGDPAEGVRHRVVCNGGDAGGRRRPGAAGCGAPDGARGGRGPRVSAGRAGAVTQQSRSAYEGSAGCGAAGAAMSGGVPGYESVTGESAGRGALVAVPQDSPRRRRTRSAALPPAARGRPPSAGAPVVVPYRGCPAPRPRCPYGRARAAFPRHCGSRAFCSVPTAAIEAGLPAARPAARRAS